MADSSLPSAPRRRLPQWVWLVPIGLGLGASFLSPLVWNARHGMAGDAVLTPEDEAKLSCSIEAKCGPLRGDVVLRLDGQAEVLPEGVQPPGYAACAAGHVGAAFGSELRLSPCRSPQP